VEVIDVYDVHAHALQAFVAAPQRVLRPAVGPLLAVGEIDVAEFAGKNDLVAESLDRVAEQRFVPRVPVGVGRIEKVDAELVSAPNRRVEILLERVAGPHGPAAPAHADRGYGRAVASELAILHLCLSGAQIGIRDDF
jgi:hypothetical protein